MIVIRLFLKIVLLPALLIVSLVKWLFIFLTSFSSVIFYLIAGIALLTAVLSYLMGLADQSTALETAATGFLLFMIPTAGGWIIAGLDSFTSFLSDLISER